MVMLVEICYGFYIICFDCRIDGWELFFELVVDCIVGWLEVVIWLKVVL